MSKRRRARLALSTITLGSLSYACTQADTGAVGGDLTGGAPASGTGGGALPGDTGGKSQAGTAGAPGNSGSSAGSSGGASPSGGSGPIIVTTGGSAGSEALTEDASCGIGTASANLKPVNMLVMFDRSSSMLECTDGTPNEEPCAPGTRWDSATSALNQFFQSPDADGLGVALRFFPHDVPAAGCFGADNGACDAAACSEVLVDMAKLAADPAPADAQETALVAAVESSAPILAVPGVNTGGTPISAALEGGLLWTSAYQAQNPEERTVLVFLTDGEPNGCEEDFDIISQIAEDALAASGVPTYAIGLTGFERRRCQSGRHEPARRRRWNDGSLLRFGWR
jgi:hypothetical protein